MLNAYDTYKTEYLLYALKQNYNILLDIKKAYACSALERAEHELGNTILAVQNFYETYNEEMNAD